MAVAADEEGRILERQLPPPAGRQLPFPQSQIWSRMLDTATHRVQTYKRQRQKRPTLLLRS